jgi:hypothetical protein
MNFLPESLLDIVAAFDFSLGLTAFERIMRPAL